MSAREGWKICLKKEKHNFFVLNKYQSVTHVLRSFFQGLFKNIGFRFVALVTKKLWAILDFFSQTGTVIVSKMRVLGQKKLQWGALNACLGLKLILRQKSINEKKAKTLYLTLQIVIESHSTALKSKLPKRQFSWIANYSLAEISIKIFKHMKHTRAFVLRYISSKIKCKKCKTKIPEILFLLNT